MLKLKTIELYVRSGTMAASKRVGKEGCKMKKVFASLMAVSLVCLLSVGGVAYDKNLKEHMTFSDDLMVGNTLVKKGDYLIKYNAQTSEVSIMDGSKVIATALAT